MAAEANGAESQTVSLAAAGESDLERSIGQMVDADCFVFGSPIYRASFASPLKVLFDRLPRGMWGETSAPLRGKAAVVVATGASLHHFLGLNDFRNVLAGFFAAHVVPPGLYVPREGFGDDGSLQPPYAEQALQQGRALVELTSALRGSTTLRELLPQA
jgi:FMN reductase